MMKKLIPLGSVFIVFALALSLAVPSFTDAQTVIAQPVVISAPACYTFNQNMGFGFAISSADAQGLALVLTRARLWNPTVPLVAYNQSVSWAVGAFQKTYASELLAPYGFVAGTGNVDTATRIKLNNLYGCGAMQPLPLPTTTTTPQTAQCPLGYICTPITPNPSYVLCPLGYICTPTVRTTVTTSVGATTTLSSGSVAPSVSFSLAGNASVQAGTANQFGQTQYLVATFPINVTSRGGTLAMPQYNDFTVVFTDSAGNTYTAPSVSVSVSPNNAITTDTTSLVTVTAQIPASNLPSSGLYGAAITSFRWNQDGRQVTQTYGLEGLRTSTSASFQK